MKKSVAILFIIICTCVVACADDLGFARALKSCAPYSENGQFNTEGMNVTSRKQIIGWQNNKCIYKEFVKFSGVDACVTCKFNKAQLNELANVIQAYSVVQQYSDETVDYSSVDKVQNNPIVKAWNKYLHDPSVCGMEMTGTSSN